MKPSRMLIAAGLVAALAFVEALHAVRYIRLDNDGMRFALVADQILAGRGLRSPLIPFSLRPDSLGTVLYTEQGPFLSILYAVMGGVRPGRVWPGQILNLCAHLATSLFSFLIARRIAGNIAGVAAGIVIAVSYPLLDPVGQFWSEAVYIAFAMMTVGMLQAAREENRGWRSFVGSGIAAACAYATRFIGCALLPIFFWESLFSWRRTGRRAAVRTILLTVPLPLLVITVLLTRNCVLMGSIRGVWFPHTERSWSETLRGIIEMNREQFDISIPGVRVTLAFLLLIIPGAALLWPPGGALRIARLFARGLDLVLITIVCYTAALAHALADTQPNYEIRYVAPLTPLLWITAIVVIARGWNCLTQRGMRRLASAGIALSLILIIIGETERSWRLLPHHAPSGDYGFESGACQWVVAHNRKGSLVVTNTPCMLAFFSGIHTVGLPLRHPWLAFEKVPNDLERVLPEKMKEIGAEYLLLFRAIDGLPREEWSGVENGLPEDVWGRFISDLSRPLAGEKVKGFFVKVYECHEGVVYRMTER
ncbi:MAG: glycosyltransferase family 39 protein [Candidatus Aureabacteria bacterium]|nr:glycosyltransferase family 39 protein [Candidatus Auribacterota bacterium]